MRVSSRKTRQESSKPAGLVLGQSPDAGTKVDEGSSVRLAVSTGPSRGPFPTSSARPSHSCHCLDRGGLRVRCGGGVLGQEGRNRRLAEAGRRSNAGRGRHGRARRLEGRQAGDRARRGAHDLGGGDVEARTRRVEGERRRRPLERGGRDHRRPEPGARRGRDHRRHRPPERGEGRSDDDSAGRDDDSARTTTAPPVPATVPDVVGKALADAATALAAEGLKAASNTSPRTSRRAR